MCLYLPGAKEPVSFFGYEGIPPNFLKEEAKEVFTCPRLIRTCWLSWTSSPINSTRRKLLIPIYLPRLQRLQYLAGALERGERFARLSPLFSRREQL